MKRVQYHSYGGPEVLRVEEVALPEPGGSQITRSDQGGRGQSRGLEDPQWRAENDDGQSVSARPWP